MNHKSGYFYLAGLLSFVAPTGIQTVLFPWLLVVVLHESPERLGLAQMSLQAPIMLLIIAGGILADRVNRAHIIAACHLLAAIPPLMLSMAIARGELTYTHLIFYALAIGVVTAFVQPARDGMLSELAGDRLQRAVTLVMGLSFGGQMIGFIAGGTAETSGPELLLYLQALIMVIGAAFVYPLASQGRPAQTQSDSSSVASSIWVGFDLVKGSPIMRPVISFVFLMSFMYGGAYVVLVPLMARDAFAGGAGEMAQCFIAFVFGTIVMTAVLMSRKEIKRPMNAMLHGLMVGGLCLIAGSLATEFVWFLVAVFIWGMCGTVPMSMSRSMIQSAAPEQYRARVLAVYSLANLGGMPLGAACWGLFANGWGPRIALWVVAGSMASIVLAYRWHRAKLGLPHPNPSSS